MLYQISNGTVSVGGGVILSHIDFEIHGNEKIAVVGRNGAGKTTLLKLVSGELSLDRDDRRRGPGIRCSRQLTVGMLSQQAFKDGNRTVEEELLEACPCRDTFERERFEYEREYDTLFTGFGFPKEDKKKPFSDERLAQLLEGDGILVSRRTVAKYRMELGIGGVFQRKA